MAKFSDKQVLELFSDELVRRLECDQEYLGSQDFPNFRLVIQSRISLLQDLIRCLDFFKNYEFD